MKYHTTLSQLSSLSIMAYMKKWISSIYFRNVLKDGLQRGKANWPYVFFFLPGIFLITLAFSILVAPHVIAYFAVLFLLSAGTLLCFSAWKVIQLKKRISNMLRQWDGKIFVQGVNLNNPDPAPTREDKKTVYH